MSDVHGMIGENARDRPPRVQKSKWLPQQWVLNPGDRFSTSQSRHATARRFQLSSPVAAYIFRYPHAM